MSDFAAIPALLDEAVVRGVAPGVIVVIGDRAGTVFAHAAGARGVDDPAPMTLATPVWLASMTKAVTSAAAMQLVERGTLTLDAPASDLLPDLGGLRVLTGFDDAGAPLTRPAARPVTLRHLLSHTAGFGYDFMNADLLASRGPDGPPAVTDPAWRRSVLLFDPGERWEYGMNTDWAGALVEAADGRRLDAYIEAEILAPLRMDHTRFFPEPASLAPCHARQADGSLVATTSPAAALGPEHPISGGGGLSGTAGDYLRFLRMILNGGALDGARILAPESVANMTAIQTGDLRAGALASIMLDWSLPFDLFPDQKTGFGLGFLINPEPVAGRRAAGSLAWAGLANTYYWIDPASDLCGVFLTQVLPFGDPAILRLFAEVEAAAYSGRGRAAG